MWNIFLLLFKSCASSSQPSWNNFSYWHHCCYILRPHRFLSLVMSWSWSIAGQKIDNFMATKFKYLLVCLLAGSWLLRQTALKSGHHTHSVPRKRMKYKWQCYHFTFVNQKIFMSVCCAKFATSRILLEWIKFLSLIMKMQKNLNSKCTEKRSQVKSDPNFLYGSDVNRK